MSTVTAAPRTDAAPLAPSVPTDVPAVEVRRLPGVRPLLAALSVIAASTALLYLAQWLRTGQDTVAGIALLGYVVAPVIAFVGAALAAREALRLQRLTVPGSLRARGIVAAVFGANALVMLAFGAAVALLSTMSSGRGRQLRRRGKLLLAALTEGPAWALTPLAPAVEDPARAALAAQWRENGRTEHASVAAFARLALDLVSLGAPPRLMADANRDALDEIRHAELCFGMARALDGRAISPGPFPAASRARTLLPSRTLALAQLAVDSLVDGALHEGTSARVIARLARGCEDPATRVMLREIAADESRHASHGWDVVGWCLAEGGAPVAAALRGAARVIPMTLRYSAAQEASNSAWERHGIPGRELEAEEYARARVMMNARLARLLGSSQLAAA